MDGQGEVLGRLDGGSKFSEDAAAPNQTSIVSLIQMWEKSGHWEKFGAAMYSLADAQEVMQALDDAGIRGQKVIHATTCL
ncbi:hypothetical protein PQR70_15660 [Paraburkholderia madseniana]|uniref:hypothetical protein n=1 Tax=Paraburkholderia madseniana TaxID=2599607 RepID=UPI0038B6F24F